MILSDSQGAFALSKHPVFVGRLRHLRLNKHATRKPVGFEELTVSSLSTDCMVSDNFTRALPHPLFLQHWLGFEVCALPS
jgi:hypothetical protein